jgi:hypothetical protein
MPLAMPTIPFCPWSPFVWTMHLSRTLPFIHTQPYLTIYMPCLQAACIRPSIWGDIISTKGLVGIIKGIGGIILELHKRECLMSLLVCRDHMVRQNKVWRYKVITHCTSAAIFGVIAIGGIVILHGTWIQLHISVGSYISIGLDCMWVVMVVHE